ncbi:MAG: SLC13 family permease [Chitinophagaceae bacterium]|nr:SLC13 family permease [Chitinophagaceae bacterium]
MSLPVFITLFVVAGLIVSLVRNLIRPSMSFVMAVFVLVIFRVISIEELLSGLSNKQIILIFLLIILTAGLQRKIGKDFFFRVFRSDMSPFAFRLKMMVLVGSLSSLINNTPIVAFMIPYVKEWAARKKVPASVFLIPLSFATILGGMITVVGTSTNLVLNGLIEQAGYIPLGFRDFLFLGILVSLAGILFMAFFSHKLLPQNKENKSYVIEHLNEYIVETVVSNTAPIVGLTIEEAGLRHLKEIFLVEIQRDNRVIAAVGPNELIRAGDSLFFAGNTQSIFTLIQQNKGLELPEQSYVKNNAFFKLIEAVVPSGSPLIGSTLKECDFRNKYRGSVISIYRKGEKVVGNLGEIKIQAGDLLLMLAGKDWRAYNNGRDLVIVTFMGEINAAENKRTILPILAALGLLLAGVAGLMDLFVAASVGIVLLLAFKAIDGEVIKKSIDIDLLAILISSLAIGLALTKSGAANFLVDSMMLSFSGGSIPIMVVLLFAGTVLLTSLITNAAAVSIMFPVALNISEQFSMQATPFFVTIAFAASASFLTPIGYQTNLMVMGPGNYRFSDFFKLGFPLLIIYSAICIFFIIKYYNI